MPHSVSDPPAAFDQLNVEVRRWIREQGWEELRDVQSRAIGAVLGGERDVLIAASTAAGKTEAAFLPILTKVVGREQRGVSVLYISPLKALINDQFRRLDLLCERMEISVVRWHGDAKQAAKSRVLRAPSGVVLITPESIEALLLRRPGEAATLLGSLDFIIIDEVHAFLQGARGLQLASLLNRVDRLSNRRARRIGLSATVGDLSVACAWLNPSDPTSVQVLESSADSPELRLQVRGVVRAPDESGPDDLEADDRPPRALDLIADHAFGVLRGTNNLFFAGSRSSVEAIADRLRRRSEKAKVPNEFFPHHGSLSKELREELELRLKKGDLPTTAIATTTLELGVDIGSVKSVAQLGAPRSLASLRQRLGRSGRRRGTPAILRIYVREPLLAADLDPLERLRSDVVQAVAAVRLLLARFIEPPTMDGSLLSVTLHQTLAIIAQEGGARPDALYRTLTGAGPFRAISSNDYIALLRHMASDEVQLIEQSPDGLVMLGEQGEKLVAGRDFYAVFQTDEEWRLVANGRTLGTIPLSNVIAVGALLVFGGQRWRVAAVDDRSKVLEVVAHRAGRLPKFDRRAVEPLHDRLVAEMRSVYLEAGVPAYLDETAVRLLEEGRAAFAEAGLGASRFLAAGKDTHVITWRGSALNALVAVVLMSAGLECEAHDMGVTVADATPDEVRALLARLDNIPSIGELAGFVATLRVAKYDELLPDELLRRVWVQANEPRHLHLKNLLSEIRGAP